MRVDRADEARRRIGQLGAHAVDQARAALPGNPGEVIGAVGSRGKKRSRLLVRLNEGRQIGDGAEAARGQAFIPKRFLRRLARFRQSEAGRGVLDRRGDELEGVEEQIAASVVAQVGARALDRQAVECLLIDHPPHAVLPLDHERREARGSRQLRSRELNARVLHSAHRIDRPHIERGGRALALRPEPRAGRNLSRRNLPQQGDRLLRPRTPLDASQLRLRRDRERGAEGDGDQGRRQEGEAHA